MVNAQEWLNKNFSPRTRSQILGSISINISNKELEGSLQLNLDNFPNLEELDCSNNQITEIKFLSSIKDSSKEQRLKWKLKKLNLSNNDFAGQDLSFLESLIELEELSIANNKFFGSLKPLKNLKNLRKLDISGTDVEESLENFPVNLKEIHCLPGGREDAKINAIAKSVASLFKAVNENKIESVREIIKVKKLKNFNFHDEHGNTLLHYATQRGGLLLLKFLIREGGDINAVNNYGWSVLHSAALEIVNDRGDWSIIELLLESGANVDAETESELTTRDIFLQKDYSYVEQYDNLVDKVLQQRQILSRENQKI